MKNTILTLALVLATAATLLTAFMDIASAKPASPVSFAQATVRVSL